MKRDEFVLLSDLAVLVRDITQFVAVVITAEQRGEDYPHWPGDEARLGGCLVAVGQRLQARLTDAATEAPLETFELVKALRAVNAHTEPVAAALFSGQLPVEKQHEFAALLSSVSALLHQHADQVKPRAAITGREPLGTFPVGRAGDSP